MTIDQPSLGDHQETQRHLTALLNSIQTPKFLNIQRRLADSDDSVTAYEAGLYRVDMKRFVDVQQRRESACRFF